MKDEKQQILLEGLAADIAAIQKSLAHQNGAKEKGEDMKSLFAEVVNLCTDLKGSIEGLKKFKSEDTPSNDQQRLIDLKFDIDRISAAVIRKDNWLRYYLSPPDVLLATLLIIFFSFMAGAFADRLYYHYQENQTLNLKWNGNN